MNLRMKLFLSTVLLLMVIIWSFTFFLVQRIEKTVFSQTTQIMAEKASHAVSQLDQWFVDRIYLLQAITAQIEYADLRSDSPELLPFLENIGQRFAGEFPYLYIGFADKRLVNTRKNAPAVIYDPASRVWYKEATQNNKPIVTEPYADIRTGLLNVTIALPVRLAVPGVLATDFYLDHIDGLAQKTRFRSDVQTLFISKEGTVIYDTETAQRNQAGTNDKAVRDLYAAAQMHKAGAVRLNLDGKLYYAMYDRVPSSGWIVATRIPVAVFSEESRNVIQYAVLTSMFALLLAFGGSFLIIRKETAPLEQMAAVATAFGQGNLASSFAVKGAAEIEALAACLDQMRQDILQLLQKKDQLIEDAIAHREEIHGLYQQTLLLNTELTAALEAKKVAYIQTIKALADAVEAKDEYTRGHSDRVLQYSQDIGRSLGWAEQQLVTLSYSAILHDIGKIGIREELLHKPERLNDAEYQIVKQHPPIGYHILQNIKELGEVGKAIYQHHERLDGSGYPQGLQQDEIHEMAKIIAIADAYDAMTSRRPYREPLSPETACRELRRYKDTHYDAAMVELFCALVEQNPARYRVQEEVES